MKFQRILELGYYPVAPAYVGEGAQIVNGQWYMPRWGCDTLQHIMDIMDVWPNTPLTSRSSGQEKACVQHELARRSGSIYYCVKCGKEFPAA